MKDLNTLDEYKKLYSQVNKLVNEIDPCFYSGPEDEYDSYVNQLLILVRDHKINNNNFEQKAKEVFFNSSLLESAEEERLSQLNKSLKSILASWL